MTEQLKQEWLKKIGYKTIIREEQPFFNATKTTIELDNSSLTRIKDAVTELAWCNDEEVDTDLLSLCIKEEAYSLLKYNTKTFKIKLTQMNGNGKKQTITTETIIR